MLLFQFILFHCTINKIRGNRRKFHNVIEKGCFIVFCCHICFQTFSIIVINRNIIFQICINGSGLSLFMKEHFEYCQYTISKQSFPLFIFSIIMNIIISSKLKPKEDFSSHFLVFTYILLFQYWSNK